MPSIRLALCSDTHFWPGATRCYSSQKSQLQPWSEQIQDSLLAELKAAAPDLVLHLGDFTCGGGHFEMPHPEFFNTLAATIQAFRSLPAEFYGLPGNHDCPERGDWSFAAQQLGLEPGQGRTIDLPQARLVLLNAQGHAPEQIAATWPRGPNAGWVNQAELARLDDSLAAAGNRPVIIFSHQLLQPWVGDQPWKDLYAVENAGAVLALLARHGNVRAVIQAHAHRLDVRQAPVGRSECWFVIIPAVIEYPLAWVQLDLTPVDLQVALQKLPLPELAAISRDSGDGQGWRAGRPEWNKFRIPL